MSVVFLHAHPDDEAIFTGGTMALLAVAGVRVVLVVATRGERGLPAGTAALGARREAETRSAAALLGVAEVVFLAYEDSGLDTATAPPSGFARAPLGEAVAAVAAACAGETVDALVVYDRGGIYPHPDHLQVHRVGVAAARHLGVPTCYEATVDYEYLHFVDVHLVEGANHSLAERARVGLPTAEITTAVDVRAVLDRKRAAMAAHSSQIPEQNLALPGEPFAAVYGWEWYVRRGPRGALDALPG